MPGTWKARESRRPSSRRFKRPFGMKPARAATGSRGFCGTWSPRSSSRGASAWATSTATGGPTSSGPARGTKPRPTSATESGSSIPWPWAAEAARSSTPPRSRVYDVNGDGLNDIICSSAHGYGIFWYEQVRRGSQITWKQHVIDDTWTQAHSLVLADLDGDGVPELIAGKRFMAHNGGDPDANGPLGLYYYTLNAETAIPSGPGT